MEVANAILQAITNTLVQRQTQSIATNAILSVVPASVLKILNAVPAILLLMLSLYLLTLATAHLVCTTANLQESAALVTCFAITALDHYLLNAIPAIQRLRWRLLIKLMSVLTLVQKDITRM